MDDDFFLLDEVLENNEDVDVTFDPQADAAKWDIIITFVDDDSKVYWKGYKLADITKLTLKYDRKTGATTAVSELARARSTGTARVSDAGRSFVRRTVPSWHLLP